MIRELWKFSIPNNAARSIHDFSRAGDSCSITFDFERYSEVLPVPPHSVLRLKLTFTGVVGYKAHSEQEQDAEMIRTAGHMLVDMGQTAWLKESQSKVGPGEAPHLRHLMIGFLDDGTFSVHLLLLFDI